MTTGPLNLVWCDLEFTTTELEKSAIMEVAMVITTPELRPIRAVGMTEFPSFVVAVSDEDAAHASDWVKENQADLLAKCRGDNVSTLPEVEAALCSYLLECCTAPEPAPAEPKSKQARPVLAGNSIHNDYRVIQRNLPGLAELLSYRLIDVSSIKELVRRWQPDRQFDKDTMVDAHLPPSVPVPEGAKHDALYDVWCSIAELNYYRKAVFAL